LPWRKGRRHCAQIRPSTWFAGNATTVEQMRLRAQYDLDYLRHWSLWLDAKILFKTALIVLH
jgi:lipopolysaccharide/colanic/teichoic acid biosynthesis glycosyltransferase